MARISGDVWDDLAKQLKQAEAKVPKIMDKAIKKAAEIYEEETRDAIVHMDIYDKGGLKLSIGHGPIRRSSLGRAVEVWPKGKRYDNKHKDGERNETIGYVNLHGRKYRYVKEWSIKFKKDVRRRYTSNRGYAGRDYITLADEKAAPRATAAIADMLQEVLEK